jgi:putative FmdB family regulatory protein
MPIYEYQCDDCERVTEALQKVDDPPLAECPHCGGPVRKLLSAPSFHFKGSGWYVTDYARKGGGGAAEGGAKGDGEASSGKDSGASSSSSGGDAAAAKPAAKSGGKDA